MLRKRVIVYLDTGTTRQHEIEAKDDADYVNWVNTCAEALAGGPRGILVFTTPSLCIYKVQNIIAVEFLDPPPPSEKLAIGFRPSS
ncbi:MAG: hypothetical protein HYU86_06465 [Chloroflexi bacterium]|nr:hypothetical protein [Chloroflexota bacterium]